MSNMTDVTSETGTVSLPNHICSVPFLWGSCCLSLVFYLVFCRPFLCVFVFLLSSLYCLFSFKLRCLIIISYLQTVFQAVKTVCFQYWFYLLSTILPQRGWWYITQLINTIQISYNENYISVRETTANKHK